MLEPTLVFSADGGSITAQQAAERFAATFQPVRQVEWLVDCYFRFRDGVKTYKAEPYSHGWKIYVASNRQVDND